MKKIYALYERLVCIFFIFLLSPIAVILCVKFVKYNSNLVLGIMACICIAFIVAFLLKIFAIPCCIVIRNNWMKVYDHPFWATNKFYEGKRSLIIYNNNIDFNDVEQIELIRLTKGEQKKYVGYKHLFSRYLKFHFKYGNPKYVYVGNYSNYQIKQIIRYASNKSC